MENQEVLVVVAVIMVEMVPVDSEIEKLEHQHQRHHKVIMEDQLAVLKFLTMVQVVVVDLVL